MKPIYATVRKRGNQLLAVISEESVKEHNLKIGDIIHVLDIKKVKD